MIDINIPQPFTYFMLWKKYNKKYYGARFAKNSAPIDVLVGKYRSSSKYVNQFWETFGPPDCIVIHRVFSTIKECRDFETSYLERVNVIENDQWLNMTTNRAIAPECSGGAKGAYASHESRRKHFLNDSEFANAMREHAINNFTSTKANEKRKKTFEKIKHSQGENNPRFGVVIKGTETAKNISNARKQQVEFNRKAATYMNSKSFTCEHCGKENLSSGNYKRWHHTKCRFKLTDLHSTLDVLLDVQDSTVSLSH